MYQRKRTVSPSSTASHPPQYSVTDPSAPNNASAASPLPLGTVRRTIKTTSEADEAAEDYIPLISGKDHPELIKGRRAWPGMTKEEFSIAQARVTSYLEKIPPVKTREFTASDQKKMAEIAAKLYQAVGEGKAELRHFSAPSLFTDCGCGRED